MFAQEFHGRILPFDAMIASICGSHGAAIATRNEKDFERCGIPIVNPWKV